jgi:hypothetical protein
VFWKNVFESEYTAGAAPEIRSPKSAAKIASSKIPLQYFLPRLAACQNGSIAESVGRKVDDE